MLLANVGLAELHTHLGGSVASDMMWSLAHEQGIALPVKDYWEFDKLVTVSDPRGVLDEFGLELGDDVELRVLDSTADIRYLVMPRRPAGTEGMSEEELAALITRDSRYTSCERE